MNFFPIGIGIDLSDTHVYVAKVSYFGRVLDVQEKEIPSGFVVDDQVIEPEKLNLFLKENFFSQTRSLRSRLTILIPESRIFRCSFPLPTEKNIVVRNTVLSLAQQEIPLLLSSIDVLMNFSLEENGTFANVETVERLLVHNLIGCVPQEHNRLMVIEAHSRALVSLIKKYGSLPNGFVGFIDVNERWMTITIFNKEQLVHSRAIRHTFSVDEKEKKEVFAFADFVTERLQEIVLYYKEEQKIIDRFILSGLFFIYQNFREPFKTTYGEVRI